MMPGLLIIMSTTSPESIDFGTVGLIFWIFVFFVIMMRISNRPPSHKVPLNKSQRKIDNIGFTNNSSEVTMTVGSGENEIEVKIIVTKK